MAAPDIANARPIGGGGGVSTEWNEAYHRDFSALADVDLTAGGDGNKTIDSKTWTLANVANATSVDVGSTAGGIKIVQPVGVNRELYQGVRNSPWLRTKMRQFLSGTDAENRADVELRVSWRMAFGGGPPGLNSEGLLFGLTSLTWAAAHYHLSYQGGFGPTDYKAYAEFPGNLIAGQLGVNGSTTPAVAYYPNCGRITLIDELLSMLEYSDDGAASLAAAVWQQPLLWKERTTAQRPILNSGTPASELLFHFGIHKNSAAPAITDITLIELKVEWRFSPRAGVVVLP